MEEKTNTKTNTEENTKNEKNQNSEIQEKKDNKKSDKKPEKKSDKKSDKKSFSYVLGQYKGEFRKIVWPKKEDLVKETLTVIVISLMVGAIIAGYDYIFSTLFEQISKLTA
ncbi:MAG: preprotein translocase subunit SecE [Firmicutes bacterium]|nr:preprotein translocase subunit SecE [Bacillota bacterium]